MKRFQDLLRSLNPPSEQPTAYRSSQLRALREAAEEDLGEALTKFFPTLERGAVFNRYRPDLAVSTAEGLTLAIEVRVISPTRLLIAPTQSMADRVVSLTLRRLVDDWTLRALRIHRKSPFTILAGFIIVPSSSFASSRKLLQPLSSFASRSKPDDFPETFEELFLGTYDPQPGSAEDVLFTRVTDSMAPVAELLTDIDAAQALLARYGERFYPSRDVATPGVDPIDIDLRQTFGPPSPRIADVASEDLISADEPLLTIEEVVTPAPEELALPRTLIPIEMWRSPHGGLPSFNRQLAATLAGLGCEVVCSVAESGEADFSDAEASGVGLMKAPEIVGGTPDARLSQPPKELKWEPDLIIGHGDRFGPAAQALQSHHFPSAKRVHILHTEPERLAWTKSAERIAFSPSTVGPRRTGFERDLARTADLAVGVGPRLARHLEHILRSPRAAGSAPAVLELLPGLHNWDSSVERPPPENQILVAGRTDDIGVKGLDIAVSALAYILDRYEIVPMPYLVVRGAARGTSEEIATILTSGLSRVIDLRVREYTTDEVELADDIWQSAVVVMPSRAEGFGLTALEAISAGVPVLVSDKSGLAETLMAMRTPRDLTLGSLDYVIPVVNDATRDAERWGEAIALALRRPAEAFQRARELKETLAKDLSWRGAAFDMLERLGYLKRGHRLREESR